MFIFVAAKKFGVTEFVNPKDHDKPVQEVGSTKLIKFEFFSDPDILMLYQLLV